MSDREEFRGFVDDIRRSLELLGSRVTDLEIGVDSQRSVAILRGAQYFVNTDEHAQAHRMNDGDVQIRYVRGIPQVRVVIGRTIVDVLPRGT